MEPLLLESVRTLTKEQLNQVQTLVEACQKVDDTALKLELAYKESLSKHPEANQLVTEFLCYAGKSLIGYLGICKFGSSLPEVMGLVHPAYRRQGVFSRLLATAQTALKAESLSEALLLTDRSAFAGQCFIQNYTNILDHSEFEMFLNLDQFRVVKAPLLHLRKATKADAVEIRAQNAIYFDTEASELDLIDPETEAERGTQIMMCEFADGTSVGKVHLELVGGKGAIYGLGIKPTYRGIGYGKALLNLSVCQLLDAGAKSVMLQVVTENENALGLYLSTGFEAASTMDYYKLTVK